MAPGGKDPPKGAKLLSDAEATVVQCVTPHVVAEETPAPVAEPGAAEPELIRKEKPVEEEGAEDKDKKATEKKEKEK